MRLDEKVAEVEKVGIKREKTFNIAFSRKAFSIIFDKMYSNKLRAIVRELYSNAYDAQRVAGNLTTPPQLHLPTAFSPEFWIRDFGTGISPQDIRKIYTTVFESTKDESDDDIGGFGLGSKTPFCYTDNFIVKSYYNGKLYTYGMYYSETGEPSYVLQSTIDTKEPNGLEVRFAVKREDFRTFETEAAEALKHFPLKPELKGQKITYTQHQKILTGKKWYLRKTISYSGTNNFPTILVGPVEYPIDISSFKTDLNNQQISVASSTIVVEADIADVEVAPNRETLSYSSKTKDFIKKRLGDIVQEITKNVEDKLTKARNAWEKAATYHQTVRELNYGDMMNCIDTYKLFGRMINYNAFSAKPIKDAGISIVRMYYDGVNVRTDKKVDNVKPDVNSMFYIVDSCLAPMARCKQYIIGNSSKCIYVLSNVNDVNKPILFSAFGIDDNNVAYTSSLPYTKGSNAGSKGTKVWRAAKFNGYSFDNCQINENDGGYYVIQRHSTIFGEDDKKCTYDRVFCRYMQTVKEAGIILDKPLYALRTDVYNKVKKNPKWINVFTHLRDFLAKFGQAEIWPGYQGGTRIYDNVKSVLPLCNNKNSKFVVGAERLVDLYKKSSNQHNITKVINGLKEYVEKPIDIKIVDARDEFDEMLKNHYPVLYHFTTIDEYISGSDAKDKIKTIADYVNLIV